MTSETGSIAQRINARAGSPTTGEVPGGPEGNGDGTLALGAPSAAGLPASGARTSRARRPPLPTCPAIPG